MSWALALCVCTAPSTMGGGHFSCVRPDPVSQHGAELDLWLGNLRSKALRPVSIPIEYGRKMPRLIEQNLHSHWEHPTSGVTLFPNL